MQKVVTKKSFIGGRMVYPGEMVDVDAKGDVMPAASTPIGNLTVDQLRTLLDKRVEEASEQFGGNVADPGKLNTGAQETAMAPIAPGLGSRPQTIPSGTEEHNGGFVHPAPAKAPAAIEDVVGNAPARNVKGK